MPIYKYLSEDRLSILDDGLIRFTQPQAFNDPFEFRPYIYNVCDDEWFEKEMVSNYESLLDGIYRSLSDDIKAKYSLGDVKKIGFSRKDHMLGELKSFFEFITPSARKGIFSGIEKNIGVLSLTKNPCNLLMWAHYANSHQGVVIEFDEDHEFFIRKRSEFDEFYHLREVQYQQTRPQITLTNAGGFDKFMVKGIEWAYEEEYRMLLSLDDADKIIKSHPFDIHLFKIPFSLIRSVTLGGRSTKETQDKVIRFLEENKELSHVVLYRSNVDEREFKLNFERVLT